MEEAGNQKTLSPFRGAPIILSLYAGVFLTYSSMLFPQTIGSYEMVAGWPLTMLKTEFRYEGEIDPAGRISRRLVKENSKFMYSRMTLNIILWTIILYGTWSVYEKSPPVRSKNASS